VAVGHVRAHVHRENEVKRPLEPAAREVFGGAEAIFDRESGAPGVLPRHGERLLRRVDRGHARALGGERLGQEAAAAPYVQGPLAPEPPERLAKIGDPHHVELVQADEGAGVVPPHAGQAFHQAIVLLPLGEPAEPRQLVAHDTSLTPITRPSRIGATAATTRGSLAASRLNARTPSASAEWSPGSTTAP